MTLSDYPRVRKAVSEVRRIDPAWIARADARLPTLTKPPDSLGRLERVASRLCGIQETLAPRTTPRRVVVFAADHGVTEEGVSAYPAAVTREMVANFLRGGAAINAIARAAGADVRVVDVGVSGVLEIGGDHALLLQRRVRDGTRNMTHEPAMTTEELNAALEVGLDVADDAAAQGVALIACGDMGIGNTTAASAITAALARLPAAAVTGRGTGIDDATHVRKMEVVTQALRRHRPGRDALEVLRTVGGLEIAAIVGAYIGAATHRVAILGDGFVATAAAFVAADLCPAFLGYWFAGHRSTEPGHTVQLELLRQQPLLDLAMRLGEGTGGALAMHLLGAAAAVMSEMATFESAGISGAVAPVPVRPPLPA
jgi:nicotinate-nucleotide--dimethylbenzimidazole phosphoribosyltransferase